MGAEPEMIYKYAKAFTRGLQGVKDGMVTGVVGSVKHFFGDGATLYGADEGDAQVLNFSTFFNRNIQGYIGAIEENIGTVMCSYSAVNGLPLAINHFGIEGLLRDDLGFKGFVISDYDEIGRIAEYTLPMANFNFGTRYLALVQIVNSGIDMLMLPSFVRNDIKDVVANMQRGLSEGLILEARIDQAVTRILAVKMAMGLVNYGE
jgi:beta-glucosidase